MYNNIYWKDIHISDNTDLNADVPSFSIEKKNLTITIKRHLFQPKWLEWLKNHLLARVRVKIFKIVLIKNRLELNSIKRAQKQHLLYSYIITFYSSFSSRIKDLDPIGEVQLCFCMKCHKQDILFHTPP